MCLTIAGEFVRAIDLVLDHYTDQGLELDEESAEVKKQAILLLAAKHLGDRVVVLQSSKLRLPTKLEDSSVREIDRFLEGGPADPHAPPGDDDEDYLIRPVRPGE